MQPIHMFTGKALGYSKYRPGYPDGYIDYLITADSLSESSIIADVARDALVWNSHRIGGIITLPSETHSYLGYV